MVPHSAAAPVCAPDASAIERDIQILVIKELELPHSFRESDLKLSPPEKGLEELCRATMAAVQTDITKAYPASLRSERDSYLLSVAIDKLDRIGLAEVSVSLYFLLERCIQKIAPLASSAEASSYHAEFSRHELSRLDFAKRLLMGTQPSSIGRVDIFNESVRMTTAFLAQALESPSLAPDKLREFFSMPAAEPHKFEKRSWLASWLKKAA